MKAYDLSGLRKITRGNTEFEMKMLNMFVDQTPSQLEKLEEYLEKEDFEKAAELRDQLRDLQNESKATV